MAESGMKSALFIGLLFLLSPQVFAVQHYLLIISGIGGTDEYQKQFAENASSLMQSAQKLGIDKDNIVLLGENRPSDKNTIRRVLQEISAKAAIDDRIFVVLFGHGNARGDSAVFNLPGPDISAEELDQALAVLGNRSTVIINTASASGPFIKALSRENRVVITATSSAREYHATIFGNYFIAAFAEPGADRDKDESISLLEAFDYARREVRRGFESEKRLLTEHAMLDDNGDGSGSFDPGQDSENSEDGAMAKRIFLQPPWSLASGASEALLEMLQQKKQIEQSISDLKLQRENLAMVNYYDQLEALLVELALLTRQIRVEGS